MVKTLPSGGVNALFHEKNSSWILSLTRQEIMAYTKQAKSKTKEMENIQKMTITNVG